MQYDQENDSSSPRWYEKIPHALALLLGIIIFVTILTYLIPAGVYDTELIDGRKRVIPGSYHLVDQSPIGLLGMFKAIPLGFKAAVEIIFIVLAGGIMFGVMEKSTTVEHAVGTLVRQLGLQRKYLIVVLMTFLFGFLGVAVGYENNIAMVPIAAVLSLALGGDLILAAGISVGAMTIGFTQNWLVIAIFTVGMIVVIYGVFNYHWYINEISAVFLMIALACGLASKMDSRTLSESVLSSVAQAAPGAFMVGFATTIKVLMEMGNIGDTISHNLSILLQGLPLYASAICMSIAQCVINLFIPSGSGQALATLPVMLPLGDVLGLSRQTTILAFQIGDGVTNLINPTLGGLIAMLAMCRVPLDRWLRFILPILGVVVIMSWIVLLIAVKINY